MLNDFPNIKGTPDYTDQPKHAHRLDIQLINEAPYRRNQRNCSPRNQAVINANFDDLNQRGTVTRDSSYYTSPVTIATKQNGNSRVCFDYTRLNSVTKILNFPIPRTQDLDLKLTDKHYYFSVLDLREAFYNLHLIPRAVERATITIIETKYRPLRTMLGYKNAPARFCELISDVTKNMRDNVFTYIDDFIIYSTDKISHIQHIYNVSKALDSFGLKINEIECILFENSVKLLGHIVSNEGMRVLPEKVDSIVELPRPTIVSEVRSFPGVVGYKRFLKDVAKTLVPLNDLLRRAEQNKAKKRKITCLEEHAQAFTEINEAL